MRPTDPPSVAPVRVIPQRCGRHAVCVALAPDHFRLGDEGPAEYDPSAPLDADSWARVAAAVRNCTDHAITFVDVR